MSWQAHLRLRWWRDGERTLAHDAHEGPLRVLRRLYPEGPGVCHHVVVHPPGGVVGGDRLEITAEVGPGAHALVTTPGATRFYRTAGPRALQQARLAVAEGARLEWLPLETIAYAGCRAVNRTTIALAPGAEALGWDVLALGLPASGQGFDAGSFEPCIEWPGVWLDRGVVDAADTALLDGPLGFAGRRVLATAWFAAGSAFAAARRDALLDAARQALGEEPFAGATSPQPGLVVVRLLAHRVEPAMAALVRVRAAWRREAWAMAARPPRVWAT